MSNPSFSQWLSQELTSTQFELLRLYEQLETMRSIDLPRLQQTYERVLGPFEEAALSAELERLLLERKLELIQRKINRRESIDLSSIDAELQVTRQKMLEKLAQQPAASNVALSKEDEEALKDAFHDITARFLPALHPDLTDHQKMLYEKALAAYHQQDLPALLLIKEMLQQSWTQSELISVSLSLSDESNLAEVSLDRFTDYTLAKDLYPYFVPLELDVLIKSELERTNTVIQSTRQEICDLSHQFPFRAKAMLEDPLQTAAYQGELQRRQATAAAECHALKSQIDELLKGRPLV